MPSYTFRTLSVLALLLALPLTLNAIIDPYGLLELGRRPGLNLHKTEFTSGLQQVKPYRVLMDRPQTLFLGSSRVGEGFVCPSADGQSCYNGAYPGGSLYQAKRLLQIAAPHVKQVYLGLDFESALKGEKTGPGFSELRFPTTPDNQPNWRFWAQAITDYPTLLWGFDASFASLRTVQQTDAADSLKRALAQDGSWYLPNARDTSAQRQASAYDVINNYARTLFRAHLATTGGQLSNRLAQNIELLEEIISLCEAKNLQLYLFVSPSHSSYLDVLQQAGATDLFFLWLQALSELSSLERPIWNFSHYHSYAQSSAPDTLTPHWNIWFNDPVHFSAKLGDKMRAQLSSHCSAPPEPDLGNCLSARALVQDKRAFIARITL